MAQGDRGPQRGPAFRQGHYGGDIRDQVRDLWQAVLDDDPIQNRDLAQRLCVLPFTGKAAILDVVEQVWAHVAEDPWTDVRRALEEILAEAAGDPPDHVAAGVD